MISELELTCFIANGEQEGREITLCCLCHLKATGCRESGSEKCNSYLIYQSLSFVRTIYSYRRPIVS